MESATGAGNGTKRKDSWIGCVPTMFTIMLLRPELDQYDLSSLKVALLSGEKVELKLF
jgi:acyl-CoA synthetase (AMP-forming)/AMP-acid ligase II